MTVGTKDAPHKDVAELVHENRHEYADDPDKQKSEAVLNLAPSQKRTHEPEPGMDAHIGSQKAKIQIILGAFGLEKHTTCLKVGIRSAVETPSYTKSSLKLSGYLLPGFRFTSGPTSFKGFSSDTIRPAGMLQDGIDAWESAHGLAQTA